ncbi:MAG TPA: hypothetical protein VN030_08325 [Cellvibrio sp.]|nr:hypothetical protein [Cellvibrio sp.]
MKTIGFWPAEYDEYGPPEFLIDGRLTENQKQKIIDYLDAGEKFVGWLGYSSCRFRCGTPDRQMGASDLTDGEWLWPEGFSHYVKAHSIGLPPEFISHMEQRDYNSKVPQSLRANLDQWIADFFTNDLLYDGKIWRQWLRQKGEQAFLAGEKVGRRKPVFSTDASIRIPDIFE